MAQERCSSCRGEVERKRTIANTGSNVSAVAIRSGEFPKGDKEKAPIVARLGFLGYSYSGAPVMSTSQVVAIRRIPIYADPFSSGRRPLIRRSVKIPEGWKPTPRLTWVDSKPKTEAMSFDCISNWIYVASLLAIFASLAGIGTILLCLVFGV